MKAIFITGAGSGMGREGATLFHANGWRVGAIDRMRMGWLPCAYSLVPNGCGPAPSTLRTRRPLRVRSLISAPAMSAAVST